MIPNTIFKLPIYYNIDKVKLNDVLLSNLELSSELSLYKNLIGDNETTQLWTEYITSDTKFLKDTQKLVLDINNLTNVSYTNIKTTFLELIGDDNFKETYNYITYDKFTELNKFEVVLQILSFYTILSPLLSLLSPMMILLIPFFIIKLTNGNITIKRYIETLKTVILKFPIGQLFNFKNMNWTSRIYTLITFTFYIFTTYQNMISCYKFYKNTKYINNYILDLRTYINSTIQCINKFIEYSYYIEFNIILNSYKNKLDKIHHELLVENKSNIGKSMKLFYKIYNDETYNNVILYTFGFHSYLENLVRLNKNIMNKTINCCKYNTKYNKFTNSYYGVLTDNPIKNSFKINKNYIITGPNASGKTTFIKSTLINIIFSQQFGAGYYDKASILPYHYLHCYINIPDTSDRDSLFQAEARQCKEILDKITINKDKRHFCIFDELFSGTNPYEAVSTAYGYLNYINKNKNLNFMLTTHYFDLCDKFDNYNYNTCDNYKLKKGKSTVKGGITVLSKLNYPNEIIKDALSVLKKY